MFPFKKAGWTRADYDSFKTNIHRQGEKNKTTKETNKKLIEGQPIKKNQIAFSYKLGKENVI